MPIAFDRYLDNAALRAELQALADAFPHLLAIESLGQSFEGRDIPVVVVTRRDADRSDLEKPAFWVDANIHATEVTGTMAALKLLDLATSRYGIDPVVTRTLDTQVLYVVPRLNPDGAARALAAAPQFLRSGTRPYPRPEREPGLHAEDIDGDGRILQMRVVDPAGDWKVSPRDPRLMLKRGPFDEGETFYRLLPEGIIEDFDGHTIPIARPLEGLDFNRNFPSGWRPEGEQGGAGEHPGSEPEIQAVLRFVAGHPNIFGALTYHTYSRALLRPFSGRPDAEMDQNDLWLYEAIGKHGTQVTGYPAVSVYQHFRYHPKQVISGAFDDWMYEHHGVLAFTVELWDLPDAAGVTGKNADKRFIEWMRDHPVEDDHRILDWVDAHAPDALQPWRAFAHPQLGPVELGGWHAMYSWRNPPPALLEAEITPVAEFSLDFAALGPRLAWHDVTVETLGAELYRVTAVIENLGFLSTSGSRRAREAGRARPLELRIVLPDGARLESGQPRVPAGHLEGRDNKLGVTFGSSPTDNRHRVDWLLRAPAGTRVELVAACDRAGTLRATIRLPDDAVAGS
ncbi:MAG: carboxypeptidase [Caldilineae bacterium]|nr:carboxypeptidase [Caldilineae bacterium]